MVNTNIFNQIRSMYVSTIIVPPMHVYARIINRWAL